MHHSVLEKEKSQQTGKGRTFEEMKSSLMHKPIPVLSVPYQSVRITGQG